MSQLTDISVTFRKLALYIGAGILGIIVLQFIVRIAWNALTAKPTSTTAKIVPSPTPDMRFGKLPYPQFSVVEQTSAGLNLELVNIEGKPPEASGTAKVYTMPKKVPSLLTNERATKFATTLGYLSEPQQLNSRTFFFSHPKDPLQTLTLDRVTLNFLLQYAWKQAPQIFGPDGVNRESAVGAVTSFFANTGIVDETVLRGTVSTLPLRYDATASALLPATKYTRANAVKVQFFRQNIDKRPVVPAGFDESATYGVYIPPHATTNDRTLANSTGIIEAAYTFWPIAQDDYSVYPLRTSDQAWHDLRNGFGTVVHLGNNSPDKILVREIYLAYLDTADPQQYLQPIFVFTGDNGFVAYLPAIVTEYLE